MFFFTALHAAVVHGYLTIQTLLIERGSDPNALDLWGVKACEAAALKDRAMSVSTPLPVPQSSPTSIASRD